MAGPPGPRSSRAAREYLVEVNRPEVGFQCSGLQPPQVLEVGEEHAGARDRAARVGGTGGPLVRCDSGGGIGQGGQGGVGLLELLARLLAGRGEQGRAGARVSRLPCGVRVLLVLVGAGSGRPPAARRRRTAARASSPLRVRPCPARVTVPVTGSETSAAGSSGGWSPALAMTYQRGPGAVAPPLQEADAGQAEHFPDLLQQGGRVARAR